MGWQSTFPHLHMRKIQLRSFFLLIGVARKNFCRRARFSWTNFHVASLIAFRTGSLKRWCFRCRVHVWSPCWSKAVWVCASIVHSHSGRQSRNWRRPSVWLVAYTSHAWSVYYPASSDLVLESCNCACQSRRYFAIQSWPLPACGLAFSTQGQFHPSPCFGIQIESKMQGCQQNLLVTMYPIVDGTMFRAHPHARPQRYSATRCLSCRHTQSIVHRWRLELLPGGLQRID